MDFITSEPANYPEIWGGGSWCLLLHVSLSVCFKLQKVILVSGPSPSFCWIIFSMHGKQLSRFSYLPLLPSPHQQPPERNTKQGLWLEAPCMAISDPAPQTSPENEPISFFSSCPAFRIELPISLYDRLFIETLVYTNT